MTALGWVVIMADSAAITWLAWRQRRLFALVAMLAAAALGTSSGAGG